eukprot:CAMPEP_0169087464 /NCGR_PEP_ID=MMETSP1015-20121227/14244_1 /TAXON_ID=342587 /ORGANISM="Karlodinium micrum, Strain CCMP2283" /LENGTH=158 /DNA_ID=CAMNT_0009147693 /DNA_START=532 /DNA_END=1009 /DNA_ORIENTATION=-
MVAPQARHMVARIFIGLLNHHSATWANFALHASFKELHDVTRRVGKTIREVALLAALARMARISAICTKDMITIRASRGEAARCNLLGKKEFVAFWTSLHSWIQPQCHLQIETMVLLREEPQCYQRLNDFSTFFVDAAWKTTTPDLFRGVVEAQALHM